MSGSSVDISVLHLSGTEKVASKWMWMDGGEHWRTVTVKWRGPSSNQMWPASRHLSALCKIAPVHTSCATDASRHTGTHQCECLWGMSEAWWLDWRCFYTEHAYTPTCYPPLNHVTHQGWRFNPSLAVVTIQPVVGWGARHYLGGTKLTFVMLRLEEI